MDPDPHGCEADGDTKVDRKINQGHGYFQLGSGILSGDKISIWNEKFNDFLFSNLQNADCVKKEERVGNKTSPTIREGQHN